MKPSPLGLVATITSLPGLTGANGALPLFSDYMARRGVNSLKLSVPQGITMVNFNLEGKPVASGCGGAMMLPARADKLPPAESCSSTPVDWIKICSPAGNNGIFSQVMNSTLTRRKSIHGAWAPHPAAHSRFMELTALSA